MNRNRISMMVGSLIILFVVPICGFAADKQQFCNSYADTAVKQYNLGMQNNLPGIVPPVWSNDRNGHFNWCMAVPENFANNETTKRQVYLDKNIPHDATNKGTVTGTFVGTTVIMHDNMDSLIAAAAAMSDKSYLGCFKDQQNRDLSGFSFSSPKMTKKLCLDTCYQKGFKYAGLQYSQQCFCDNSYGKLGKSDNCNMPCSGNKGEICGGSWANSIYQIANHYKEISKHHGNIDKNGDFIRLDEAIPGSFISRLAPVFDFDGDGCLPSAGIGRNGQQNPGLKTSGAITGQCRSSSFLETSNTVHRYACTTVNGSEYCGHFYALYFKKDQNSIKGGHRHDWEHVAIWTTNGVITHGGVSAHGGMETKIYSALPHDKNNHLKVVYHKDGLSTHALRFAKKNEVAENPYHRFVTPTIASWYSLTGDGISNSEMRTRLNNFNYGNAVLPLRRCNFFDNLNNFKPSSYPVFQPQEDCQFTDWFSEENPNGQMCPTGYVVTGIKCSGDYCDNKQLQCCRISNLVLGASLHSSQYFSEEKENFYRNDREVVVGMRCAGRYCDKISLITRSIQKTRGIWTTSFSEEMNGQGNCSTGSYVLGVRCTGRYCDSLSLYCGVP